MSTIKKLVCPRCGSDDVQEFVALWENANQPGVFDLSEYGPAELYSELRWCNGCECHPEPFNEVQVEEADEPEYAQMTEMDFYRLRTLLDRYGEEVFRHDVRLALS